jgi:uncharacterized protein (TIGR02271 family)
MNTERESNLSHYIDHRVVDPKNKKIGKLTCLWSDASGQPAFLGIQTGWLFGRTHVVPAQGAGVSQDSQTIRIAYSEEQVKGAPTFDPGIELDDAVQRDVLSYYGGSPDTLRASQAAQTEVQSSGAQGVAQEEAHIPLSEEELRVGKRQVEAGGVRLRKIIRTETTNQPVELQREEIVVERVPGGEGQSGVKPFEGEDVYIPLRREEAVVEKASRVREEVRVRKTTETDREIVSGDVRREDVDIESTGEAREVTTGSEREARPSRSRRKTSGEAQPTEGREWARARRTGGKAVFCICQREEQASRIVDELKDGGFSNEDISVMFADQKGTKDFAHEKHTKAPEGAVTGAAAGGLLGGGLGWLAGVGTLAIPGIGPFVAAGPLMAALGGAAFGASTGGIVGALIGVGMPEYEAKRYENKLREGNVLVSVHSDSADETRRAKAIFEINGGDDIATTGEDEAHEKAA